MKPLIRYITVLSFVGLAALTGCGESTLGVPRAPEAAADAPLDSLFAKAGAEFGVPADLLASVAYAETRWEMVQGEQEFEGMPAASGVMALRGPRLVEGARLAGVSETVAASDAQANIRAAAAWMNAEADRQSIARADLGAWAPVVAAYSGIELPEAQAGYVHGAVYRVLNEGVTVRDASGQALGTIAPRAPSRRTSSARRPRPRWRRAQTTGRRSGAARPTTARGPLARSPAWSSRTPARGRTPAAGAGWPTPPLA